MDRNILEIPLNEFIKKANDSKESFIIYLECIVDYIDELDKKEKFKYILYKVKEYSLDQLTIKEYLELCNIIQELELFNERCTDGIQCGNNRELTWEEQLSGRCSGCKCYREKEDLQLL